jgi:SAM-dependent methyltransferase
LNNQESQEKTDVWVQSVRDEYESVPYDDGVHPATDPSRLAAVGRLFGIRTADLRKCRVLELGCGQGTNLLALAERLPGSRFLGLDFSGPQIAAGQSVLAETGLQNIELRCADLLQWQPNGSKFDFIICHGVFSWVPDNVKQRILELCRQCLAPNGIACISYAAYPGSKQDEALRDLLRVYTQAFTDMAQKIASAQTALGFLERAYSAIKTPDAMSWRSHVRSLKAKAPNFLFHDDLSSERDPCYLLQFAEWASEHGLQYVGDSDPRRMFFENLPAEVATELAGLKLNRLLTEQFLDFIANRKFRVSLLTHSESAMGLPLDAGAVRDLCLSTSLRAETKQRKSREVKPGEAVFRTAFGGTTKARSVPLVGLLRMLVKNAPARVPFAEALVAAEAEARRASTPSEIERLCRDVLSLYARAQVELWALPLSISASIPDHPRLSPLNHLLAKHRGLLVSAFHMQVQLNEWERQLAALSDGTRDVKQLCASEPGRALGASCDKVLCGWTALACLT